MLGSPRGPARRFARRGWTIAVVLVSMGAAVAVGLAVHGSGPTSSHELRVDNPDGSAVTGVNSSIPLGTPYKYVLLGLCTVGGNLTVTSVRVHDPIGNIAVADFATTATVPMTVADSIPGTAASVWGASASNKVSGACGAAGHHAKNPTGLAVSVTLGSRRGVANGFDVQSTGGAVYVPFGLAECTTPKGTCAEPAMPAT